MRKHDKMTKAFSLVEVVIALAICSFALIAILGLLTIGLQSTRDSSRQFGLDAHFAARSLANQRYGELAEFRHSDDGDDKSLPPGRL